jgi:hypothetical protein
MISFFKSPTLLREQHDTLEEKIKTTIAVFLICLIVNGLISAFLMVLNNVLLDFFDFSPYAVQKGNLAKVFTQSFFGFVFVVVIAPFLEEIVFRLPLRLEKISIALSVGIIAYRFLGNSFFVTNLMSWQTYMRLAVGLGVFFLTMKCLSEKILEKIRTEHYGIFFYSTAALFAIVHISNFFPLNVNILWAYPLFVLPQFVIGLLIGFVRVRNGFVFGCLLHSLINTTGFFARFGG